MEYYVQKINHEVWVNIQGPFGSEGEARIYARSCTGNPIYGTRIRIATGCGSVVDIL